MTPDQFWQLVEQSRLYRSDELESLRKEFVLARGGAIPAQARPVAEWLLEQRKLTGFQARQLLKGKSGPFQFGDYQVLQRRIVASQLVDRFDGLHISTRHRVLLHVWPNACDLALYESLAETHREIRHANVNRYYETVAAQRTQFGVSESPAGETLRQMIDAKQRLAVSKACHVVYQASIGLAHLHALGLVHGCLRPDEIIIQSGGHVKLIREPFFQARIDLSKYAKIRPAQLPHYLAPELHRMNFGDERTDIYALGCILYEAVFGQPPYPFDASTDVLAAHRDRTIEPPNGRSQLSDGLWEVIRYATAKDRNQRYRKVIEFAEKLEPFLPAGIRQTSPQQRQTESLYLSHLDHNIQVEPKHLGQPAKPESVDLIVEPTAHVAKRATARSIMPYAVAGVSAIGLGIVLAVLRPWSGSGEAVPGTLSKTTPTSQRHGYENRADTTTSDDTLTDEQRRLLLWESPTQGSPVDLALTPAGSQLFMSIRLQNLTQSIEGQRTVRALGPRVESAIERFEAEFGVGVRALERLTIAFSSQNTTVPQATMVGHFEADAYQAIVERVKPRSVDEGQVGRLGDYMLFFPVDVPRTIVWGPASEVEVVMEFAGDAPPLRREMERLLRETDSEHDLTVLLAPNFLAADGQGLLKDALEPLRIGILDFIGDSTQAACLGAALRDSLYVELKWVTRIEENPLSVAQSRRGMMQQFPDAIYGFLDRVKIDRFWQPLAIRYPRMVQYLAEQTRVGVGDGFAVMNTALPPQAAHNLLLATELALANIDSAPSDATPTGTARQLSVAEILDLRINLRIDQQSLEAVVGELVRTVRELPGASGFETSIIGADLQGDGITRNQQIRNLVAESVPVRSVLTEITRRGNPLPVDSLEQLDQKLVWVPDPTRPQGVIVTTRTAATKKGFQLPSEFVAD